MAILYQLPFPNPNLADGFGSLGYWDDGKWVKRPRPHQGVDFPQAHGAALLAIADGVVADTVHSGELGWITVLRHERTAAEKLRGLRAVFSFACHQSTDPSLLIGRRVARGAVIGHVGVQGKNGTAAAGEHLHLAMSHDVAGGYQGRVFDPIKYINARRAAGVTKAAAPKKYTVRNGDTLWSIAQRYRTTYQHLATLNGIHDPNVIRAGQVLRVS